MLLNSSIGAERVATIEFDIEPFQAMFPLQPAERPGLKPYHKIELNIFFEINGADVGVFAETMDGREIPGSVKWIPANAAFLPGTA